MGEIGDAHKSAFLGNARALLFPIDWPEPFGLVMIEAMACGTPVVAWRCGSVPEIIDEGDRLRRRLGGRGGGGGRAGGEPRSARVRAVRAAVLRDGDGAQLCPGSTGSWPTQPTPSQQAAGLGLPVADVGDPVFADDRRARRAGEPRVPLRLFALKHGDTFVVADAFGDILGDGDGLFRDDTRSCPASA